MDNKWSDEVAGQFLANYGEEWGEDLALRAYCTSLISSEADIVPGLTSSSVKGVSADILGQNVPSTFVFETSFRGGGEPSEFVGTDQTELRKLRALSHLDNERLSFELQKYQLGDSVFRIAESSLLHAFLPQKYIDFVIPGSVLALTNQVGAPGVIRDALGDNVIIIAYTDNLLDLAKSAADAFDAQPDARAMVIIHRGLVVWGDTARESYDTLAGLVTKAHQYAASQATKPLKIVSATPVEVAEDRYLNVAPILRGLLAQTQGHGTCTSVILRRLINREALDFVDADRGKELALTPPLIPEHAEYIKHLPLWLDSPDYDDTGRLREQILGAINRYKEEYGTLSERYPGEAEEPYPSPRVILMPGLGAICAARLAYQADEARDVAACTFAVKSTIAGMGDYQSAPESFSILADLRTIEPALTVSPELSGKVALVTGAAGAIGSGVCRGLHNHHCHVVATDLPGPRLDTLFHDFEYGWLNWSDLATIPMDVTDSESVRKGIEEVVRIWGGIDIVVVNAGVAMVSSLEEMDLEAFRRLERINVEGTLLTIRAVAKHFRKQGTGGDIILVSTKNVFAPGAKFGAYSATKAAAHQLARVASLELAEIGVRVNMVSPDAVFSDGTRKSGLWQEVGPERMKARGLDEKGLEEYYRTRNLLKARVTADHVANAVLFFASRQTPTTGATIPVDGGLPDATPR